MYKLAIFDFDGTLVDSAPGIIAVMCEVAREYGLPDEALEKWKTLIGVALNEQVDLIIPEEPVALRREIAERYRQIYNHRAIELCPLFPDLLETLTTLQDNNITISIATSKKRKIVDPVLHHHGINHYFKSVIGSQDVSRHKPDPESVFRILRDLGFDADSSVVVGDSRFDLEMARNAMVDAIGVTTGVHSHSILNEARPMSIKGSLSEVTQIIVNGRSETSSAA